MKRKLIASLLCLCMLISLLPVAAFAVDESPVTPSVTEVKPDANGAVSVSTKEQLTTAVSTSGVKTITLTADIDMQANGEKGMLSVDQNLTIDLGTHTLNAAIDLANTTEGSTLTLKNGTLSSSIWAIWVQNKGILTVDSNMTVTTTTSNSAQPAITVQGNDSTLNINGKVTSTNSSAISGIGNASDGGVIINIGESAEVSSNEEAGIYYPNTSTLTIEGAVSGTTAVYQKSGRLIIKDGAVLTGTGTKTDYEYNGNGYTCTGDALVIDVCDYPGGAPTVEISGGTFTSTNANAVHVYTKDSVTQAIPKYFITSGTFSSDVGTYVPASCICTRNTQGKYIVKAADGLAGAKDTAENGTTTVSLTGNASTGKVDSDAGDGLDNVTQTAIKVDASADNADAKANAEVNIAAATAQTMTNVQTVEVKANDVTVTLPKEAVSKIAEATENVTITVKTEDAPAGAAAQYEVSVTAGDENILSGSGNGNITITVTKPATVTDKVFAYWVNGTTILSQVDAKISGSNVIITTPHLSKYQLRTTEATDLPEAVYTNGSGELTSGTLTDAISNAVTGSTIILNKDITLTDTVTLPEKDITIDGMGHTISFNPSSSQEMMFSFNQDANTVTFKDVKLNPASKGFAILCKGGNVILTDSSVTGGKNTEVVGGIYFGGSGKLTLNGNTNVSNNESSPAYNNADIWIASTASAEINGENVKVGRIFVNANTASANPSVFQEGTLAVKAGTVESVMLEANSKNTAKLTEAAEGTVKELLIALGDAATRPVAQITPTGKLSNVQGFNIPNNQTATIIGTPDSDGKTNVTLEKAVTIETGAILTVPKNTTVTVTGTPTITNNGTLIVDGALIAGTDDKDSTYLTFAGNGAVAGSGTIDIDKTAVKTATVKLDVAGGTGVDTEYKVIITAAGDNATATFVLPTPTRSGYEFQGWKDSNGKIVTSVTLAKDAEASFTAQWKLISSGSTGGGGGSSASVSVPSASNGKVTVSNNHAKKGDTVTITLTPNTGYVVDTVTVTDSKGNTVEVSKTDDTHYTFVMPDGRVTVKATFKQADVTPPPATGFTDVAADAYYADAVKWAVDKGITNGLTATTFGPNNSCTRGQMVTFLWRAAGSPAATGTNSFTDVASGEYYYNAVLWAVEKGITNGTSATTFSPNATVNRGQTVTFLYRYAESPAATGTSSFTDVTDGAFYADAVKWAVAEEITNGTSATTFSPNSNCTRGQIVTFMYRQMAE